MPAGGSAMASAAAVVPRLRKHFMFGRKATQGFGEGRTVESRDGRSSLRKQLSDMGRQIHHLAMLFHELEASFENEGTVVRNKSYFAMEGPDEHPKMKATPKPPGCGGDLLEDDEDIAPQPYESLLSSICDGDVECVQQELQKGADPNVTWRNVHVGPKQFVTVTPLAAAVVQGSMDIVDLLVERNASSESLYSFPAGAEQQICTFTAVNACIPSGNLEMLERLAASGAKLDAVSSNGANLVWQAAYFGHEGILGYLLGHAVPVECRCVSQDNSEVQYSPLHVAAVTGKADVVSLLLEARANVRVNDGQGREPLDDAARLGHARIVKDLVEHNADILRRDAESGVSCLDLIFDHRSSVLTSMVAQGLMKSPKTLDSLTKDAFLSFLRERGSAPIYALRAIFQPHELWYWEEGEGRMFRKRPCEGYLDLMNQCNTNEGPHIRYFVKLLNNKKVIDEEALTFIDKLLPQKRQGQAVMSCWYRWWEFAKAPFTEQRETMFVPATAFMCHIPFLHNDLRVLLALLDCPNLDVFSTEGCRAIISWRWSKEKLLARFRLGLAFFESAAFMVINFMTDETVEGALTPLLVANWVCLLIWFVAATIEVAQIIGYVSNGLVRRYFSSARHWLDLLAVVLTGAVNVAFQVYPKFYERHVLYSVSLGLLIYMKWLRLLVYLRQIKSIGIQILPIMQTMFEIKYFLFVLVIWVIATVNLFFALDTGHNFLQSSMLVYNLVVFGDGDVESWENRDDPQQIVDQVTGEVSQLEPAMTKNFAIVHVMIIIFSFLIGVSLMNLFLAMLCVSYSAACDQSDLFFVKSRLNMVLDQHAVRLGITRFCCCFRRPTEKMVYGCSGSEYDISQSTSTLRTTSTSAKTLPDGSAYSKKAFLWYTVQTEFGEDS